MPVSSRTSRTAVRCGGLAFSICPFGKEAPFEMASGRGKERAVLAAPTSDPPARIFAYDRQVPGHPVKRMYRTVRRFGVAGIIAGNRADGVTGSTGTAGSGEATSADG